MELRPEFQMDRRKCAELIRDPEALALPLMTVLLSAYGPQVFEEDPIDLWLSVEEDFNAQLTEEGENRVNASILALTSDLFYSDPLVLRATALALFEGDLGDMVNGVLEDIEFPEALWAVYEVGLMRGDDEEFSDDVSEYIDRLMRETSEDNEDLGMEPDEAIPYAVRFLEDMKGTLRDQLRLIGVSESNFEGF